MASPQLHLELRLAPPLFPLQLCETLPLEGVIALFGPSGGGKTSLLRVIAGFLRGEARVLFDGEPWQDAGVFLPPHRRPVGFLFQDGRLFRHLSVAGNLRFAARRATKSLQPEEVIRALDLEPLLNRATGGLSGGEAQRVALARTLLSGPRLLLLDEPLAALDAVRKREILPYLERIVGEFQMPAIYVSHALDEVVRLAERVLVLAEGRVRDLGLVEEILPKLNSALLSDPAEAGTVLPAEVIRQDADYQLTRLRVGARELTVPGLVGRPGQRLRLQVRDRDVSLALQRQEGLSIRNQLPCRVLEVAEEKGAHALVTLDMEGRLLRSRITRASVAELGIRPGRSVFALVKTVTLRS